MHPAGDGRRPETRPRLLLAAMRRHTGASRKLLRPESFDRPINFVASAFAEKVPLRDRMVRDRTYSQSEATTGMAFLVPKAHAAAPSEPLQPGRGLPEPFEPVVTGRVVSCDPPPGYLGFPRVCQDSERPVDAEYMQPDSSQHAAQVGSRMAGSDGEFVEIVDVAPEGRTTLHVANFFSGQSRKSSVGEELRAKGTAKNVGLIITRWTF